MAISSLSWELSQPVPLVGREAEKAEAENWYGLQTRPRHEKIVRQRLEERGVMTFLPLVTEVHRWSDRKRSVQMPLFSCYVFAKFVPNRAAGTVSIVRLSSIRTLDDRIVRACRQ